MKSIFRPTPSCYYICNYAISEYLDLNASLGSVFMLLAILFILSQTGTTNLQI
nr:putative NADH dehydrogenase subunit 4 [Picea sitchensis]